MEEKKSVNAVNPVVINNTKKILGIPIALFIIMCVVIVAAATITLVYIYEPSTVNFTKTLLSNPTNVSGTRNIYVSILTSGDATNGILNCETENCSTNTEDITLTNSDPVNSHNCIVTTIGSKQVSILYSNIGNNITLNDTSIMNQVNVIIQPNSSIPYNIIYSTNVSGSFPVSTNEYCP